MYKIIDIDLLIIKFIINSKTETTKNAESSTLEEGELAFFYFLS